MADVSSVADPSAHRPWQFSLRSLFALTFSVAIGLSFWKVTQHWYSSTLAALSFWIILGLMSQVVDLWGSIRQSRGCGKGDRHLLCEAPEGPFRQKVPVTFSADLPSDERWGLRFALVWRLALCCLIVAALVVRSLIGFRLFGYKDDEDITVIVFFTTARGLWDAVLTVSIIAALASSPRLMRPKRRWPWTWAVNLLGLIAAGVFLAGRAIDSLLITFLVHATISCILSAQAAKLVTDSLDSFNPKRILQFCDLATAGVVFLLISCVSLWLLALRWRSAPWQRLGLGILLVASLAAMVLLAVRIAFVEIPVVSPVLAANISVPGPPRLAAAAVLVLIVATVVALRWSELPAEHTNQPVPWRRDEGRYHHERRWLAAALGGAAIASLVVVGLRQTSPRPDWDELAYLFMIPENCLTIALVLVAVASVSSGWFRRSDATAVQPPRLAPGLFLVVWSGLLTIIVCSAPLLGAWGLAFWIRSGR
jgi:hypothetical protein